MKIKIFNDYHEIQDTKACYSIELGCFPPKGGECYKYFALFYNKKLSKPKYEDVKKNLFKKIDFGDFIHYRTGKNISISQEEVEKCVRDALK
jgi:hypothetical protein